MKQEPKRARGGFSILVFVALLGGVACDARLMERLFPGAVGPTPPPAKPIPRNAPLWTDKKDEIAARMAWGRKHVLLSYDKVGVRDPKWDDAARQFIESSLPTIVGGESTVPADRRIAAGRAIVDRGCKDPLVFYLFVRALFDRTWDAPVPEYLFAQAVQGLKTVPYPRAVTP